MAFRTRMTELLGIERPIMLAGMNWITDPSLVAAVCNAGGLGVLAVARFTPEETLKNIREVKERTDRPFGINQILIGPRAAENIQAAIEEKVAVVNYSLGKPWFVDQVHAYGGKVIGTIAIAKHAVKAEQLGCDALIVTGHEAAAHGAAATSLVLIPIVASSTRIPLIAAGGFHDGRGLAAALALGADGISMGTRFALTRESLVHDNFKKLCLQATEQDTLYSDRFDGMPGRVLKSEKTEELMKSGFPLAEAIRGALEIKKFLQLSFWQFIRVSLQMMTAEEGSPIRVLARQAAGNRMHLKAVHDGDEEGGILFAGQDCGGINDVPSVEELMGRVMAEAEQTVEAMRQKLVAS